MTGDGSEMGTPQDGTIRWMAKSVWQTLKGQARAFRTILRRYWFIHLAGFGSYIGATVFEIDGLAWPAIIWILWLTVAVVVRAPAGGGGSSA